jgi:hypothetical protein
MKCITYGQQMISEVDINHGQHVLYSFPDI